MNMAIEIEALNGVPEGDLKETIANFAVVKANIVTAINDTKGTFSVEATFIDPGPQSSITLNGKMSTFGGPQDMGVGAGEGLALYEPGDVAAAPAGLFLDTQPPNTTGLARRLNPAFNYLACRWDFSITPRDFLRSATITVSAKGKSITARAADKGPNVSTGRVADLSPGLAHALGLNTDDTCTLLIPTPAGTQIPIPAAAPLLAIDLRSIDAAMLPKDKTKTLLVMTATNNIVYWVVTVVGSDDGGQTLLKSVAGGPAQIILSDTVIFPVKPSADIPDTVAGELNKAIQNEPPVISGPGGSATGPAKDVRAKMFAAARAFVGHSTHNVPGTQNGALACAWAVNEVARIALGKPISTDGGSGNGLSTDGLFAALKARHTKLASASDAQPGDIIIAPTIGANHGHVGIVGTTTSSVAKTLVFSNSSHPGVFKQNFTIGSFTQHYQANGLQVLFFALKQQAFV
jgi:hypothetical protein